MEDGDGVRAFISSETEFVSGHFFLSWSIHVKELGDGSSRRRRRSRAPRMWALHLSLSILPVDFAFQSCVRGAQVQVEDAAAYLLHNLNLQ